MDNKEKIESLQEALEWLEDIKASARKLITASSRLLRKGLADGDLELMAISKMLEDPLGIVIQYYADALGGLDMDREPYMRDLEKELNLLANSKEERARYRYKDMDYEDIGEVFKGIISLDNGEGFPEFMQDPKNSSGLSKANLKRIFKWYEEATGRKFPEGLKKELMEGAEQ